jgi:hypothetical protein
MFQLRAPEHRPVPPMSTDEQRQSFDCPKCGVRLHVHNSRTDLDDHGQLEQVYVYLCLADGLFTFRNSKGLAEGL